MLYAFKLFILEEFGKENVDLDPMSFQKGKFVMVMCGSQYLLGRISACILVARL